MKAINNSSKTEHRKMFCEHFKCKCITTHRLKFKKTIYDDKNKEWNVIHYRTCVICESRNPAVDNTVMSIMGADDWNALISKEIYAE